MGVYSGIKIGKKPPRCRRGGIQPGVEDYFFMYMTSFTRFTVRPMLGRYAATRLGA
jgi:hypothetical protein